MNALSTTLRVLAIIGALAALGLWIQLGDQKEKLIKEGRELTTQRDNLQTELNTTTATLTETKSKLSTKTEELDKNVAQLEQTSNLLDSTSKERDGLKATLAERDATIVDRDAKVASMQEEIGMLNEKIAAAVTKDMYDKALAATEAARKEIADKDVKISELAHKLSLAEAQVKLYAPKVPEPRIDPASIPSEYSDVRVVTILGSVGENMLINAGSADNVKLESPVRVYKRTSDKGDVKFIGTGRVINVQDKKSLVRMAEYSDIPADGSSIHLMLPVPIVAKPAAEQK